MNLCLKTISALAVALVLICPVKSQALKFHSDMNSIKIEAQPGQVVTRAYHLTLDKGEKKTQFKAHLEDWWRSEDGKQSFYRPAGSIKHSCASWITLNPAEAAIGPGETLTVRISTVVPADIKSGGYWCALTVDEVADPLKTAPQGVGVVFTASVSVGIFISITPVDRNAKILQLSGNGTDTELKVVNEGNCPLGIEGRIEFYAPSDTTKPIATVKLARTTVLPEPINTIIITAPLPETAQLPNGKYLVRAVLDIGLTHYIGAQKTMDIVHGTSGIQPEAGKGR